MFGKIKIGYNSSNAEDLVKEIKATHEKIADAMKSGWNKLSRTMQDEWVGADESNAEATLAKHMCDLFASCATAINGTIEGIAQLNTDWVNFTNQNKIQGGQGSSSLTDSTFAGSTHYVDEGFGAISDTVKDPALTFSKDQRIGLASAESAGAITSALDIYVEGVGKEIDSLYTSIKTTDAFFGEKQEEQMAFYLQKVGEALGKVVAYVEEIKTALTKVVTQVTETAKVSATAMETAANNINVSAGSSTTSTF